MANVWYQFDRNVRHSATPERTISRSPSASRASRPTQIHASPDRQVARRSSSGSGSHPNYNSHMKHASSAARDCD